MKINIWKYLINPIFSFILCIIVCFIFIYTDGSLYYLTIFISLSILSFIISIMKSNNFSKKFMILTIIIILFVTVISFFCVLMGYLAWVLIFFLWIFSILISMISIILSMKYKINHIINYVLLFFISSVFIGFIFTNYNEGSYEKKLLQNVKIIEDYYDKTNKKYDKEEINRLLNENNKKNLYRIEISDDNYEISIHTINSGWLMGMGYNSGDKIILKDYKK